MPQKPTKVDKIARYTFWGLGKHKNIHVEKVMKIDPEEEQKILDPHRINFYVIRWVVKGSGTVFIDHVPIKIQPDLLIVGTPKQITHYQFPKHNQLEFFICAFNENLLTLMNFEKDTIAFLDNLTDDVIVYPNSYEANFLREIFDLMIMEFRNYEGQFSERILAGFTKSMLLFLFRMENKEKMLSGVHQGYINLYRKFLYELEQHFKSFHYVADYTELLHVTEKKLNRACKAITRETVSALIQKRIDYEIKRLLFYSTKTVKEIGYEMGFKDSSYFTKFFKTHNGITPLHFREIHYREI